MKNEPPTIWNRNPEKYRRTFREEERQRRRNAVLLAKSHKSKVCRDEVEWFVKMVEERKQRK